MDEIYALFMCSLNTRDMHKLRTFEPERGHRLSTWIGLLATNAAWDYLRTVARQPVRANALEAEDLRCGSPDPFHALAAKEEWTRVSNMLSGFSEKDRTFVELFFMQGRSPEQIAEEMRISVKTVYSKKHKIRCRLESVLGSRRRHRPPRPPEADAVATVRARHSRARFLFDSTHTVLHCAP